jgi:hypothetical protein
MTLGADGSLVDGGFVHPGNFCKTAVFDKGINAAAPSGAAWAAHPTYSGDAFLAVGPADLESLLKIHNNLACQILNKQYIQQSKLNDNKSLCVAAEINLRFTRTEANETG